MDKFVITLSMYGSYKNWRRVVLDVDYVFDEELLGPIDWSQIKKGRDLPEELDVENLSVWEKVFGIWYI